MTNGIIKAIVAAACDALFWNGEWREVWEWESESERDAFRKLFRFAGLPRR